MTHKDQVIENIIAANSKAFRAQVAQHAIITSVIDDMLNDPQWADDLARYAASPRKNDKVKTGFSFMDVVKAVIS